MTDVADDPNPDAELDLRDAVEVARTIADLVKRVRDLETRQQLGSSTTSDTDDPDAPTVADVADLAQTATFDIAGLSEALEGLDTALTQNAEDVRIASIAAEAAGEAGTSAAQLANEAADDALAKADEAKAAADDALEAAANAGGGNAYENRAPTSADQADPDTGRPFRDAALWFVRATNTGIVTGAYQYAQPDPSQPGTWTQITLSNEVLGQLDAGKINTGFLSAERIEAESITGAKIATDTLTSRVIAADAITAAELAADAVLARSIKAGEIQTGHLAALLIDASKIQAGAVIAEKIAAGAVTADSIAAGAITATKLSADAINGKTITGITINGGTITGATVQTATTGKRVVLGSNVMRFYDTNNLLSGTIEGTNYGGSRSQLIITGYQGSVLQVGPQDLPNGGTAGVYADAMWSYAQYVSGLYRAENINDDLSNTGVQQWTGSNNVPSGGSGTNLGVSTAPSTQRGRVMTNGGNNAVVPAGVYLAIVTSQMSAAATGRAFLQIGPLGGAPAGRAQFGVGENWGSAVGIVISDGTTTGGRIAASGFQQSGSTVTFNWTITYIRIF